MTPPIRVSATAQNDVITVVAASITSNGALASLMPKSHMVMMVSLPASKSAAPPPAAVPVVSFTGSCMTVSYLMTNLTMKNPMIDSSIATSASSAPQSRL